MQAEFYKNVLGLDELFDNQNSMGLGKNGNLFIVLREDKSESSHHLTEHKGPQILTFKCEGSLEQTLEKIKTTGFKIRDTLKLPTYNRHYLFIEDFDSNEICLDFPLSEI